MQAGYLKIICLLPSDREDPLAGELTQLPVLGSSLVESGDGMTEASIYLDGGLRGIAEELRARLIQLGAMGVRIETEEPRDWIEEYRRQARPFAVGSRWWIDPGTGADAPAPSGRIVLSIEPSTAFGSGTHESTRLALMALESPSVPMWSVLDVGTGTGILALAADALGAHRVIGVDIDPDAIWSARRTASRQRWCTSPIYVIGTIGAIGRVAFSLVMCNMLVSEMLCQLAGIRSLLAPGGRVILSGVLVSEREELESELAAVGLSIREDIELSGWLAMVVGDA